MRREKISCRAFRREKNILPTRLLEKKILDDQLNGRPLNTIFQIAGDFFSDINHHIGFPLSTLIYYAIYIHGPTGDILIVIVIVCVNKF